MGAVNHTKRTRDRFLAAYRKTGMVQAAAQLAGVDRSCHYRWLEKYGDYRLAFEACRPEVSDLILDEVVSRGTVGWDEPVFHGGKRAMDFARDDAGNLILKPCKVCGGNGKAGDGPAAPTCPTCKGSGKGTDYVAVPASVRKKSDACLLALAEARVTGFQRSQKHRLVDEQGKDRPLLDLAAVEAFMASRPTPAYDETD